MNRFIAGPLAGLSIILVGSVIVSGLIDHLVYSFNLDQRVASALGLTGLLACLYFGIQFGIHRARVDRPRRLTRWNKAILFVLVYVTIRIVFSYVKAYYGARVLRGGPLPPMETVYQAMVFDEVLRLPFSVIDYKPLQDLEMDYDFEFFFINGALWAVAGICIIAAVRKIRTHMKRAK